MQGVVERCHDVFPSSVSQAFFLCFFGYTFCMKPLIFVEKDTGYRTYIERT